MVLVIGYTNITVSVAKNMIDSTTSPIVLDVRTQSEYNSGHIRNAKHIPVGELEGRLDELETADEILVYCRSGGRSASASQILADNGFSHVYNMLGGITAWIDAGYPVYIKYSSIQEAINSADGGDAIYVSSGTYYENVVMNKTVSLIGEDRNNTIIDGNGFGHVVRITTNNVTIASFTVLNSMLEPPYSGIYLHNVKNSNIGRNIILNGYRGLWLYNSSRNIIEDNAISNISESLAIWLDKSNDNVILANFISNCSSGIYLGYSHNNKVQNNDVSNNTYYGISLVYSNGTTINGNILFNNAEWNGISLYVSNNNSITGNSILKSTRGLKISESHGNIMYHNNFVNNTHQVIVSYSSNNAWDNGCEGNYWRNYNGTDLNGDGIGDTNLSWESVDYYPLMNLYWNPADINHDLKVDIYDVVLACSAYTSTPSDPHWNPHCDIAESYGIIDIYDIVMICTSYGEEYNP